MTAISLLAGEMASRRMTIVVAGGGSVGDFGGFVASVFKRGVRLVNVPTTWLAAMDSSHGGKNGLNVAGAKNQIGRIHQPAETLVIKSFLIGQPDERAIEAAGEALKMAMLQGQPRNLKLIDDQPVGPVLWKALPGIVRGKLRIVAKDPNEESGYRHLLNLGHTMGHVFEAGLKLPHGLAVAYGVAFAAIYSKHRGICSEKAFERMISHPLWPLFFPSELYLKALSLPAAKVRSLLLQDKKRTKGTKVRFIFLKDLGRPVIWEVQVEELLKELKRQKDLLRDLYA
jgi:3-dehydroquinate synthase